MIERGGNQIRNLKIDGRGSHPFLEKGPYEYRLVQLEAGDEDRVRGLASFTVFIHEVAPQASLQITSSEVTAITVREAGTCIQGEKIESVTLRAVGGKVTALVAGTPGTLYTGESSLKVTPESELKKVSKPWGHEIWVNGEHPNYALKKIFIRAGTKTSLQYHRFKQETNVLFGGRARLFFKQDPSVDNDAVTPENLGSIDLDPISSIDVYPGTLHRLEALSDVLLCETSTPHLNDVVRVQDDAKRPDGRIASEHQTTGASRAN